MATAWPDSSHPYFPTETKLPWSYDIAHRVCSCPSSVVPIIPLPGISPSDFASRHAAEWFHIGEFCTNPRIGALGRADEDLSRHQITHTGVPF